jgi:hypothetical protein
MKFIETNRGIIVMADAVDYGMWRSEKAWELAMRVIPSKPDQSGAWIEANYLKKAQEELDKSYDIVNTVFAFDKINK